jgi:protease I
MILYSDYTMQHLPGRHIAILATDGVEQSELTKPLQALKDNGAKVSLLSIKEGAVKAWDVKDWGKELPVDRLVSQANVNEFDGLVLPGGVMNPDFLRADRDAVQFVKHFYESGKPIAAICHGPWTLIEAGIVSGKTLTSWPSLKTDLQNAGANWIDEQVVVDKGLITSRKPDDLPLFIKRMIEEFQQSANHHRFY